MGRQELYLSFTTPLAVVVHNAGPRSGVIFDLGYRIEPVPAPFNAAVLVYMEGLTRTVAGKATESVKCNLTFSRENVTIAEALRAFTPGGADFTVTITYRASRGPFGHTGPARATQVVSRQPLAQCVNEWAKSPPPPPVT